MFEVADVRFDFGDETEPPLDYVQKHMSFGLANVVYQCIPINKGDVYLLARKLIRCGNVRIAESPETLTVHAGDFFGHFEWSRKMVWFCHSGTSTPQQTFHETIAALVAAHHGVLFLHSSAVYTEDGNAVAFVGVSGQGKSSIAGLVCPPSRPLGDDQNVLFSRSGEWFVGGSPFREKPNSPKIVPRKLTRLCVIGKGDSVGCRVLSCCAASALRIAPHLFQLPVSCLLTEVILGALQSLMRDVPIYYVTFPKRELSEGEKLTIIGGGA